MSTAHSPAAMPRMAHWPFLLVLIVVPPRPGSSSFTLAPSTGLPSGSSTLPSSRPWPPRQSWAPAGTASARIAAARDSLDSDITYLLDGGAPEQGRKPDYSVKHADGRPGRRAPSRRVDRARG